nr:ectonucleoside triphosphate diphosphohydrolase [Hymenolepis microstoma]
MGVKDSDFRKSCVKYVLIALLILIFCIICILVALYVVANNAGYAFALLIDAGSTSSKLSVFSWKDWPYIENGYVQELGASKVSPGISFYKDDPVKAFSTMESSIHDLASKYIPSHVQSRTHQYLAATAGMRLLNLENPLKSDAIIEALQLNLHRTGLKLGNPYSDVRVMSGRDEGIYAFITVNYLLGNFGDRHTSPVNQMNTVGSLDLGGASTQIAFVPASDQNVPHISTQKLFGNGYRIYSFSYLCYGKSAAEKRIWAEIISKQNDFTSPIENPCLHEGKVIVINAPPLFNDQCVSGGYAPDLVGSVLTKPANLPENVTFKGTGDPDQCRILVQTMFQTNKPCSQNPCMFGGIPRPDLRGKFYAFSGFTYSAEFYGLLDKSTTRDEYKAAVDKFCKMPYSEVENLEGYSAFTYIFCFDGVYIEALLAGYGFEESESWKSITFANKINNAGVSWAMGYTIDATGMIESASPQIRLELKAFIASVVTVRVV